MRPTCVRSVLALAAFGATLTPAPAHAQGAPADIPDSQQSTESLGRARVRYDAGTRAFGLGRYVDAALEFEAAASEKPSPIALYTAALSWERANVPDRAADDYARTVALPGLPPEQAAFARQRLAALETVLGALSVTAPEGWRVQLDANTEVGTPADLHGTAGMHTLLVRPAGELTVERVPVALRSGTTLAMTLPVSAAAPGRLPPASSVARTVDVRRSVGLVVLGAAGTALLAGGLLGLEAVEARDAYDSAPTRATFDHASHLQTWTNVAFVAGGCLLVAGLGLTLWPAPRSASTGGTSHAPLLVVGFGPAAILAEGSWQ